MARTAPPRKMTVAFLAQALTLINQPRRRE
jgi:hypothetical protein